MSRAENELKHSDKYPYDALDAWWKNEVPHKSIPLSDDRKGDWAMRAARGIISDLQDRRDIKRGFENVDEDVRVEIVNSLAEIIRTAYRQALGLPAAPSSGPRGAGKGGE